MSPWTKRLQRSTRSFAPFSGALFHCACASFTQIIGAAAPAATPAPTLRKSLRLKLLIAPSSVRYFGPYHALAAQASATSGDDDMDLSEIRGLANLAGGIGGALGVAAFLPQIYRIAQRRSAVDVSLAMYVSIVVSSVWWMFYAY